MERIFEAKFINSILHSRCYDVDEYGREVKEPMAWKPSDIPMSNSLVQSTKEAAEVHGFKCQPWCPKELELFMFKKI